MNHTELIDNYLNGELSGKRLTDFENRLINDIDFAREVKTHREVNNFIRKKAKTEEFKNTISEVAREYFNGQTREPGRKITRNLWIIRSAAAVIIFIITGTGLYLLFKPVSPVKLYAQYYRPYPTDVFTRSENNNKNNFITALQYYQQKNYEKALQVFSSIPDSDSLNISVAFFSGISYLENGNNEKAITCLQKASGDQSNALYTVSQWYLSLAYLKNNEPDKAIPLLRKLKESGSFYSEKASLILDELN